MDEKDTQTLIVVDENDNFIKYSSRAECHKGNGIMHRAIAILIYNKEGKILLQKRKHKLFDNMWDLAGATHPLHINGRDESYEESGKRCLMDEWNIKTPLKRVLAYTYFEKYGEFCENEYCVLLMGEYNGKLYPNPDHAYAYRWISWEELIKEIGEKPKEFTPWLKVAIERIKNHEILRSVGIKR